MIACDGRGRGTGPSPFVRDLCEVADREGAKGADVGVSVTRMAAPVALALGFAVQLGLLVSLAGRLPAAALIVALAAITAVAALVATGREVRGVVRMGARDIALSALAGSLAIFLAPYLVVSHRFSDAPPGTETIFFAGVAWGAVAIVVAAGALVWGGRRRMAAGAVAGLVAALTGAAGILGNWERPSSFSPLIRFPAEEAWMAVGGVCFVLGGLLLAWLGRTHGKRLPLLVGSAAALAASGIALASSREGLSGLAAFGPQSSSVLLWAFAWALTVMLWIDVLSSDGPARAGACLVVAPVMFPALLALERAVGVSGPDPLVWGGIAGGSLLMAAGVARLVRAGDRGAAPRRSAPVLLWYALAVAAVAAIGLGLPALHAAVSADRAGAVVSWSWIMPGWETVAGWTAVSCALLLVAAVLDDSWWPAVVTVAAALAYPLVAATPLHVLTGWLPPDIQQDFGTEYASIVFRAIPEPTVRAAVFGAVLGLVVVSMHHLAAVIRTRAGAIRTPPDAGYAGPRSGRT